MFGVISILIVLIFILIEYWFARSNQSHAFRYDQVISNLSTGILERSFNLLLAPLFYQVFCYLHEHFAIVVIPSTFLVGVLLLLVMDFVWYWYHRLGHSVNIFWAAHIVHHSSSDFNFTTAARITILQEIIRSAFWCTLPIIGFHPSLVTTVLLVHGAYSFFTHTRQIKRIRWIEYIFITPSLHRVHHACNGKYLDKNYGDVFVFWDKIFGTFAIEDEEPIYGLTHPLKSNSFLWIHFHYYLEIIAFARTKKTWQERLKVIFGPPTEMSPAVRIALERKWLLRRDASLEKPLKTYINLQVGLALFGLVCIFYRYPNLTVTELFTAIGFIFLSLIIVGALLERKRVVFVLELLRLTFLILAISVAVSSLIPLLTIFVCWSLPEIRFYLRNLYERRILRLDS